MLFVINSGSSSLKFKLYGPKFKVVAQGLVERVGQKESFLDWSFGAKKMRQDYAAGLSNHEQALQEVFAALRSFGASASDIRAVGHRVVHGGDDFTVPVRITDAVLRKIKSYDRLAPLHNPANRAGIVACRKLLPYARQVACFDTAYYRSLAPESRAYGLPYDLFVNGYRRYGFHGLSHEYVAAAAAKKLGRPLKKLKLITCHLGSGCSVTATKFGRAVETSMGYTPTSGILMATRPGDVDPGLLLAVRRERNLTAEGVESLLNRESGWFGLSGFRDLRDILSVLGYAIPGHRRPTAGAKVKKRCQLAFDVLCHSVAFYVGAYAGLMGGVDAVVFTAGVGERSQPVRQGVTRLLKLSGQVKFMVVPTDEERMIAEQTASILGYSR